MILRATLKSVRRKPVRLAGTMVTYVLTLASMLALISILVATMDSPHPTYLLVDVDAAVRVDIYNEFSISESEGPIPQSLDVRISSDQLRELNSIDGVEAAFGFSVQPVSLMADDGDFIQVSGINGTAWKLDAIEVTAGTLPELRGQVTIPDAIALEMGIVPGDSIMISTVDGPRAFVVSGTFAGNEGLNDLVLMADSGSVSYGYQFVTLSLGNGVNQDDVQDEISAMDSEYPLDVLMGNDLAKADPTVDTALVAEFGSLLGVMAGFMGFVSIFVMLSTIGFAIYQRAGQIAIERAVGYTPNQVRKAVVIESLIVSVVGTFASYLLALPIEATAVAIAKNREIVPDTFEAGINPTVTAIMLPSMVAVVLVVAWWASRRTLGISPIAAMRDARAPEDRVGIRRWIFGLGLIVTGLLAVALSNTIPPVLAMIFSLFLVVFIVWGISLIGPVVIRIAVGFMAPVFRSGDSVLGIVAVQSTRRMASRVASGTTPVMLGAGFLIMMFFFTATMQQGTIEVSRDRESADFYLVPTAGIMPAGTTERLAELGGVESVSPMYILESSTLSPEDNIAEMDFVGYGVERDAFLQTNSLDIQQGTLDNWGPGTVIVSDYLMFDSSLEMDKPGRFLMPDGSIGIFDVVAVAENTTGSGDVFFHMDDVRKYQVNPNPERISINLATGSEITEFELEIEQLQSEGYPVQLLTRSEYLQGMDQSMSDDSWATYLIIGSAAALGMVASINTLAMSTLDRAREFALMRLVGATRRQVMRVMLREGVMIGIIGVGVGVLLAILSAASVSMALVGDLSAIRGPVLPTLGAACAAFLTCIAAVVVPTHFALNRDPMSEISTRE